MSSNEVEQMVLAVGGSVRLLADDECESVLGA